MTQTPKRTRTKKAKTQVEPEEREVGKHIDVVFAPEVTEQIEVAKKRLHVLVRGELIRRCWRLMWWMLTKSEDEDWLVIYRGEPPELSEEQRAQERVRVPVTAIL